MPYAPSRLAPFLVAALSALVPVAESRADSPPPSDADLAAPVDRRALERAVLARSPSLVARRERARAAEADARAEGSLPPPEAMGQLWQIPIARPWAVGDAQMAMVGLTQAIPPPGVRGLREEARAADARAESAEGEARARELVREIDHAWADYVESTARHAAHLEHGGVMERTVAAARARLSSGGTLADLAQAEVELARLRADLATEASAIAAARVRINGLLARDPEAPLGDPVAGDPASVHLPAADLLARARAARPEIRVADARRDAGAATERAATREARVPSFSVSALYFPPVGAATEHGWGAGATMSLPWLAGGLSHRADAERSRARAALADAEEARLRAAVDVVSAAAAVAGAEARWAVLAREALPAAERARLAADAAYASGRGDLAPVLASARAVVDVRMDLVEARAALDHALADLDWAAGGELPRSPIVSPVEHDHGR
jgi:outer membrane protein TolC